MSERANCIVLGKHLIAEMWARDYDLLNSPDYLRDSLIAAAQSGNFSVLDVQVHTFSPHGVTGVVLLAESHMSIHTWPEHHYAALDIFTCAGDAWAALNEMKERLNIERIEVQELDRGVLRIHERGLDRLARR